jgi:hypothetical protein
MFCYRCHSDLQGMPSRCPFCTSDINPWTGGPPEVAGEGSGGGGALIILASVVLAVWAHWGDTVQGWLDTLQKLLGLG